MAKIKLLSGVTISAVVGIMILVISAYLDSPPAWLLVLGWLTLGTFVAVRIEDTPNGSPYKKALYLMILPLVLYAGLWGSSLWRPLYALLSAPSAKHLTSLLTGKPFLWLIVLYLACVCFSFRLQIHEKELEGYREDDPQWLEGKKAFKLGEAEFFENHTQEALSYFDRAIDCGFSCKSVYDLRGLCLQGFGFHFDAIDDFNKAISLEPADGSLYSMRSLSRRETGDLYGCIADLNEATRLSNLGGEKNAVWETLGKELGYSSVAEKYKMDLVRARLYIEDPDSVLGRRLRGNLRRRTDGTNEPSP